MYRIGIDVGGTKIAYGPDDFDRFIHKIIGQAGMIADRQIWLRKTRLRNGSENQP